MTQTEKAAFAAGCFWGIEHRFRQIDGVIEATSGYMNGKTQNPSYKDVCSGTTGHAEAVQVIYDPAIITYDELLSHFWDMHDPTQKNRQGPDVGTQYRSGLYVYNDTQEKLAKESLQKIQSRYSTPIATEIKKADTFWEAEEYHQRYIEKNGGICHL